MKKLNLLLLPVFSIYAFLVVNTAYGFSASRPVADGGSPSSLAASKYLNASEFIKLSVAQYITLTGKRLNVFQKLAFRAAKMRMKHDLKKNPSLLITDYVDGDGSFRVDPLWLILGVLLGPIAVLIAYVTKQESLKITSSWIGFGVAVILVAVLWKSIF